MDQIYDGIVIGGGAAGMMAAGTAARNGKSVLLLERNDRLGKKLRITGKGRCNLTNAADLSDFFDQIPTHANFLYSALYSFTNDDTIALFDELGVPTKVERGGRVFPQSDSAQDVVAAMKRYCADAKLCLGRVAEILIEDTLVPDQMAVSVMEGGKFNQRGKGLPHVTGVKLADGTVIRAKAVVVATGGASYPQTGSTGDGYRIAQKLGHTVTKLTPSLVPLTSEDPFLPELMGLSLKNVEVSLYQNGKRRLSEFGEMLFTHFGVSGPVILTMSSRLREGGGAPYLLIDFKPALDEKQLDQRILRDFEKYQNRDFINSLSDLLPAKLIPVVVSLCGIDARAKVNQITKDQRKALVRLLKGFRVNLTGKRPLAEAIVTSGGVSVKEIDPGTMESKRVSGLYFAGEVIDVDAYTGGYNLQIAFSTGHLAGMQL